MKEIINKLQSTTFQSTHLTNDRLKYLANLAQITEDHVSRIGLAISISHGRVNPKWLPNNLENEVSILDAIGKEKHIRSKTLLKDDLTTWLALILQNQNPGDYNSWRNILRAHWERGVEILMAKSFNNNDWIRIIEDCFKSKKALI
jgi:hypothetical protein